MAGSFKKSAKLGLPCLGFEFDQACRATNRRLDRDPLPNRVVKKVGKFARSARDSDPPGCQEPRNQGRKTFAVNTKLEQRLEEN